jgi:diguanylate cyclase (GGDEF)-like protein
MRELMSSPFFYIMFSLMISSAVLSVVFFIAWSNFGRAPYALSWSLAFLAGAAQWAVAMNEGLFPSHEVFLLSEYACAIALTTLGLRGHCQRTFRTRAPQLLVPAALFVLVLSWWYIAVEPHVGITEAIIPAYAALTLFASAFVIVNYRREPRPSEWAAAFCIALFGVAQAASAWIAAMQGPAGNEALHGAYLHFTFLTIPAGYLAMAAFIILMMASDMSARMKQLAVSDQLTGLLNRRGFNELGERAFSAARRSGEPLSVILTDIDRFKCINDRYGHAAGDSALEQFAQLVRNGRRREDIVARVGGEEFALLLPGTDLRDAMAMADQLCKTIGATPVDLTSIGLPMTSSFGVAALSNLDSSLDDMVRRADRALYRSKRAGRNQVDLESSQLMLADDGSLRPVEST